VSFSEACKSFTAATRSSFAGAVATDALGLDGV
jgi:hypothetical protein